jgi:purine nucleosidase
MRFQSLNFVLILISALLILGSCSGNKSKIKVIFDSDTNNELDDQHALAYLLKNEDIFDVEAVTVNNTWGGGGIDEQYNEAKRVIKVCGKLGEMPLLKGADRSFHEIFEYMNEHYYDGMDAVEFIISKAKSMKAEKLVIIAVGKLTNIALALDKDPSISQKIKVVWLGSNYPDQGEYNLENDVEAMNFVLSTDVPFEMVLVRYGLGNGTDKVRVTLDEIRQHMSEMDQSVKIPVIGRHGGEFFSFGAYSIDLFEHVEFSGNDRSRALFDMAAVAIVKNPGWAHLREISAPVYESGGWIEVPENSRKIGIREDFDRDAIVNDFFSVMKKL